LIEVEESAKPFAATDGTRAVGRSGRWKGNDIAEALVIPFGVIMRDELPDRSPQMTLAEWDDVPQAFLLNRANESFRERVQIRSPSRQQQELHARRIQETFEMRRVERIAIDNQIARAPERSGDGVREIARDLCHPLPVRLARDARNVDAARFQIDHEQHEVTHEATDRQNLDADKSAAAIAPQCAFRNVLQGIVFPRSGAGSIPCSLRIRAIVERPRSKPRFMSAPRSRVYPHEGFRERVGHGGRRT